MAVTYFDQSLDFEPVAEQNTDPILPEERFTFELVGLERSEPDQYRKQGGIKWTFAVSYPNGEPFIFQNEQYTLWRTTGVNANGRPLMNLGTQAHEWASALMGRTLGVDETLKVSQLRGKKMSAMVVWRPKKTKPKEKTADLASLRHIPTGEPEAQQAARPSATAAASVNVDGLRDLLRRKVRQAEVLQSPEHLTWIALNIDAMDADDCNEFIKSVQADIDAG